jgi:hypothetical protein
MALEAVGDENLPKFFKANFIPLDSYRLAYSLPNDSLDGILWHQFNKRLSLLLYAIHCPFYWQILKKSLLFSGFKNPPKKIRETRKL